MTHRLLETSIKFLENLLSDLKRDKVKQGEVLNVLENAIRSLKMANYTDDLFMDPLRLALEHAKKGELDSVASVLRERKVIGILTQVKDEVEKIIKTTGPHFHPTFAAYVKCKHCGNDPPAKKGVKCCRECGADMDFFNCGNCGERLLDGTMYCPDCHTKLN